MRERFNAVIIGSGIGGLTCGAFLARAGMRVCICERHHKTGGYAHNFRRRSTIFESGIHSVPMGKNGVIDYLLSRLGVAERLQTIELPEMYHLQTPGFSFTMPSRQADIRAGLNELFPRQRRNLERLFAQFRKFNDYVITPLHSWEDNYIEEDKLFVSQFQNRSYSEFISQWIDDENLKRLFFGQWPYAGGSPESGGALFYSMMFVIHYFEGSHTLHGGFSRLADALAHAITGRGGIVRTRSSITGMTVDGRRVRSVRLATGEEIETDLVVSNISPYTLHGSIIPRQSRSKRFLRRLSNLNPSVSAVIIYCSLKQDTPPLFDHNTTFWFSSGDFASVCRSINENRHNLPEHLCFLQPAEDKNRRTLTLLYFVNNSASPDWKRDKPLFCEKILSLAEKIRPGLRSSIDFYEAGSPATFERYTGNTGGALYGFENTSALYGEAKLPATTHLDNLFQTGHWGKPGCGIFNVMFNGYSVYHTIMKTIEAPKAAGKDRRQ